MNTQVSAAKKQAIKKYTKEEAAKESKAYFAGEALCADVFINKYALRDLDDRFDEPNPGLLHKRLASEFARIDSEKYNLNYEERFGIYYDSLKDFSRIVAQGSPMAAIGNPYQIMSASNCVVVESPEDSIAGITKTGTELAQLYKRRCGVGVDVSSLRPDGMKVNNAARTTSGAWSFADYYSYITRMIGQSGRRGALMITLDVHHPDVEKFATMKKDLTKVTGANVSIRLSDEFLRAVDNNQEYEQRWPCEGPPLVSKMVSALQVWKTIINNATTTAEPGLIFWDRMTKRLPAHSYPDFKSISTNPCSEISLSAYDSCRLISMNLTGYVTNAFEESGAFDWKLFKSDVTVAMQMADNLVDLELELIEKIKTVCDGAEEKALWQKLWNAGRRGRRTGLGTHGLGDMLAQLRIKYDSQEALDFVAQLYEALRNEAYITSVSLAETRGPFPAFDWELEKNNEYIRDLPPDLLKRMSQVGRRNISLLTQAPTGSISILSKCGDFNRFNVSSGVEPVFRTLYTRRKRVNPNDVNTRVDVVDEMGDKWQEYNIYHSNVLNYMEKIKGINVSNLEDLSTQKNLREAFAELPDYFVTSDQINWQSRVKLQGVEQLYLDHSISSTINLPRGTTPDVVGGIYLEGWKKGLKGVTVYVDGSRDGVLITKSDKPGAILIDPNSRPEQVIRMDSPKRPKELPCDIHHCQVSGQQWIALVGLLSGEPYEMFGGFSEMIQLPKRYKTGTLIRKSQGKYELHVKIDEEDEIIVKDIINTFNNAELAWVTRLVSTALRHGTPVSFLSEQLSKEGKINDFNKVLSRVLKKYIKDGEKVKSSAKCGSCGSNDLKYQEGCPVCLSCGHSRCN